MSNTYGGWFFISASNGDTFSNASLNDLLIYTDTSNQNIIMGSIANANLQITYSNVLSYRPVTIQNTTTLTNQALTTLSNAPYLINNFIVAGDSSATFLGYSNATIATTNYAVKQTSDGETFINSGASNPIHFSVGGQEVLRLNPVGDLDMFGVVLQRSDRNLKTDLVPISSAVDKINQLTGYTYKMRNRPSTMNDSAGLIAQEVQKVLPQAVKTSAATQSLTLDYSAVSALYVESIKELHKMILELQEKIKQ